MWNTLCKFNTASLWGVCCICSCKNVWNKKAEAHRGTLKFAALGGFVVDQAFHLHGVTIHRERAALWVCCAGRRARCIGDSCLALPKIPKMLKYKNLHDFCVQNCCAVDFQWISLCKHFFTSNKLATSIYPYCTVFSKSHKYSKVYHHVLSDLMPSGSLPSDLHSVRLCSVPDPAVSSPETLESLRSQRGSYHSSACLSRNTSLSEQTFWSLQSL